MSNDELMTKLCAAAMERPDFDPLHNDADAFALLKKFPLWTAKEEGTYRVWIDDPEDDDTPLALADDADLNRAIVRCVARMLFKVTSGDPDRS